MSTAKSRSRRPTLGRRCAIRGAGTLIVVAATLVASPVWGDDYDRGGPTLDELLDLSPVPASPKLDGSRDLPGKENHEGQDPGIIEALDALEPSDMADAVLEDMAAASVQLDAHGNAGIMTQRYQEAALAKLDAMIEEAKHNHQRRNAAGESGSTKKRQDGSAANAPRQDAGRGQAPGQQDSRGDFSPGQMREASGTIPTDDRKADQWGNLPPRLRTELIQASRERFSALYRTLTEDFYRNLAERDEP